MSPSCAILIGRLLTAMPSGAQRVVDGAGDRRRRAEIAGFAGALLPEHGVRRRRHVMDDLDLGHLVRRRQQIVHEGLRDELPLVVVGELLVQRRTDAVGNAAHGHAAHDLRIDHGAAIVADEVAPDLGLAEIGIDRNENEMKLEGEAGIHLHAAVGRRQLAAGRHHHHVAEGEPRLGVGRQAVEIAVGDGDEFGPAAPGLRRGAIEHVAGLVGRALRRNFRGHARRSRRAAP